MSDALHVGSGKVRELYALDDDRLLLVASDRISTFDVILPTEIPDKGRVLTGLSAFWFARTRGLVANHLLGLRDELDVGREERVVDELHHQRAAERADVDHRVGVCADGLAGARDVVGRAAEHHREVAGEHVVGAAAERSVHHVAVPRVGDPPDHRR